jgi:4-diphosphocytidyl-2-C-methyl-D-erythritol kinase
MLLRAFAKINLDLKILGRRADGYHEIRTILQTIDWCDEIRIEPADTFQFVCAGLPLADANGASNLVVRAVHEFERATGRPVHAHIDLVKNIPAGAGLGGGSADAAVTLMGLQQMYGKVLSPTAFLNCLRSLGSDVPFFAVGGKASGTGRGDEVVPQEDESNYWLVVVSPRVHISTVEAYSWLTLSGESNTIKGFYNPSAPGREVDLPGNDFESAVFERHPVLKDIQSSLLRLGARQALLSGSGSALFGRFDRQEEAVKAASQLDGYGTARVTRPLSRLEYLRSVFVQPA